MRWFRNPFSRKPKLPPINEDWKAGDFAECICADWERRPGAVHPKLHGRYLVLSVGSGVLSTGEPTWGLALAGCSPGVGGRGWAADCFRKVYPDAFEEPRAAHREISREKERVE